MGSGRLDGKKNESLTTTITSIYTDITTKMATSTQVDNISKAICYTSSDTLKNAITHIDNELGDGDDKVKDMISNLQSQITALQNALSTPAVFTYSGAEPDETYFKDNELLLSDGTTSIPAYSVNTTNKTVVYMIPNDKTINSSQTFDDLDDFTCTVNVNDKKITFTSSGK